MSTGTHDQPIDLLREAVQHAKEAFARLPQGDEIFQRCMASTSSLIEVVDEAYASQKSKKSARLLEGFHKHTLWLQKLSPTIEVAVQTQAGIACPAWAPVKFVLLVVGNNAKASQEILEVLNTISRSVDELNILQELHLELDVQTPLINLFADIVEFAILALKHFHSWSFGTCATQVRYNQC
jgi:hypothetical protein